MTDNSTILKLLHAAKFRTLHKIQKEELTYDNLTRHPDGVWKGGRKQCALEIAARWGNLDQIPAEILEMLPPGMVAKLRSENQQAQSTMRYAG